jgi:hypothetical protein
MFSREKLVTLIKDGRPLPEIIREATNITSKRLFSAAKEPL